MTAIREWMENHRCGALPRPNGAIQWRVWAPRAKRVQLVLCNGDRRRAVEMEQEARGFFRYEAVNIPDGQRYAYRLDDGPERPDPCSRWQPDGVHAPSAVVRIEQFTWSDQHWKGIDRADLVFYELHVGTFTPEGTFEAVIPRLESLRQLGVTAVEIMPVAQFPGTRNWGYDGVSLFAPQNSYGGPHGLQRLVDACHAHGLAIVLDVVYNHVGPEGNYLAEFGPYFTNRYRTHWGPAFNYSEAGSDPVRAFVLDNARFWIEDYHFDGLRLDAVHAIFDPSARSILWDLGEVLHAAGERLGRRVHAIAESDLNDPRLLWPVERGGYGLDAQWSDDFHHAVHTFLTGERQGYYEDFGKARQLAKVLEQPFLYAGDYSRHRDRIHGAPPEGLSGDRFIISLQNHDQVGNRARGDRLGALLDPAAQRLAASLLLLAPHLPLLFMGEEYGETRPFPFFCSFSDEGLIEAVREGRRREFASFAWQGEILDPHAESTFTAARLSWSWPDGTPQAGLRRLYADLLAARKEWPALRDFNRRKVRLLPDENEGPLLELIRGGTVAIYCNLSKNRQVLPRSKAADTKVLFSSESRLYQGARDEINAITEFLPHECIVLDSPLTGEKGGASPKDMR